MTAYRFLFFDAFRLVRELELSCADDLDALDAAHRRCSDFAIEVYDANRFVARVNVNDEPPGVGDQVRRDARIRADRPLADAES